MCCSRPPTIPQTSQLGPRRRELGQPALAGRRQHPGAAERPPHGAHPTSQGTSDTGTVPVLSYNSNAIPVAGLERLEVLLDGAAAIYGADAVAGVVNTVLQDDFDGLTIDAQYGGAEGTRPARVRGQSVRRQGFSSRGNISLFANYTDRTALMADDQDFTSSDDMRPFFAGYPGYETVDRAGRPLVRTRPGPRLSIAPATTASRPRSNGTIADDRRRRLPLSSPRASAALRVASATTLPGQRRGGLQRRQPRHALRHPRTARRCGRRSSG